ncbi:PAS domain-containing protein [Patescibacteria group bacterium]|nr:PAS domain-containing protein [Patescibacteria group bacterium]
MTNRKNQNKHQDKESARQDKLKADFITIASHQLRTPISAIRWSLDMLLSNRAGKISAKQKEYINQAYYNTDFLARVVSGLLTVTRMEDKGVSIDLTKVDFGTILNEIIDKFIPYAKANNCTLNVHIAKNVPNFTTDAIQIKTVLNALLDNAIRYSRRASRVVISVKKIKENIEFRIEDSGIGVPKDQQQLVFTKFFRANNAMRSQTEGMGLQLYISKNIVEALGGKMWFESEENDGSIFFFTLPLLPKLKVKKVVEKPKIKIDEDELEYLYRHITDGLIIVDNKQQIQRINHVAESFFDISEKDVLGKDVSDIILNSKIIKAMSKESIGKPFTISKKHQNYRVIIFPIKSQNIIDGWIIILYDQSKNTFSEGASEEIKKEREFVAITVHELKSPLGITKWSLEMLQSENAGKLNKDQRELISQIYRGNERLLVLVRDLLNLSKLQEGKFEVEAQPCYFQEVVSDIVKGFKSSAKKKKVILVWSPPKLPKVLADKNRVAQVAQNLISNAIKYTKTNGKVTVDIKKFSGKELKEMNKKLKYAKLTNFSNKKGYLVFSVKDTGIGISLDDQKRLFGKFFRSKDVLKSKTEGTGLGLYITKSIVMLHKGDIWFESTPKEGSIFYFSLPIN